MSQDLYLAISSYRRRAFSLVKLMSPYFSESQLKDFRELQARTGAVISGSMALQFFGRIRYDKSDLDIYVEHGQCLQIAKFLEDIGYLYKPRPSQGSELAARVDHVARNLGRIKLDDGHYLGRGMADVFNFDKGDQKIQLITAVNDPVEVILAFHSSEFDESFSNIRTLTLRIYTACVMNFITHSHAFSLYPRATFVEHRSLVCPTIGSDATAAKAKYQERGWNMVNLTAEEARSPSSDFRHRHSPRWIGDSSCWTITLPPLSHPVTEKFFQQSWQLIYIPTSPTSLKPFMHYRGYDRSPSA